MKDPYLYEGTNTLINRLGIKDDKTLDKAESDFAYIAIKMLKDSHFDIKNIKDCLLIHKTLFEKVYDWAGQIRTIDIFKGEPLLGGKSIDYVLSFYIEQALNELEEEFAKVKWNNLETKEKLEKICYFVSEFWHIHPFREGNTRTTAMMLYFLIKKAGLHVNIDYMRKNGKYFRNALVLSCLYDSSKSDYLFGIVSDSVTAKNEETGKYETIDGIIVDKYSYTHHTMEKLETIKKPKDWTKNK